MASNSKDEIMTIEAKEALASARATDFKKKVNAASWSPHMETLMKTWGEKSAGLRYMHGASAGYWKGVSNKLSLTGIGVSSAAAIVSLVAASIDDVDSKNVALFVVGGVSICSSVVQSLKKFYNSEEKSAEHGAIAKQFGSFYRYMTLQMGMTREDRLPADQLSEWALKEYERLQQDSLPLGGAQIKQFKAAFKDSNQAVPDVCENTFEINVYKNPSQKSLEVNSVQVELK